MTTEAFFVVYVVVAAIVLGFGLWHEAGIPADKRQYVPLWFLGAGLWPVVLVLGVVALTIRWLWEALCRSRGTEPWSKNDDHADWLGPTP